MVQSLIMHDVIGLVLGLKFIETISVYIIHVHSTVGELILLKRTVWGTVGYYRRGTVGHVPLCPVVQYRVPT